MRKSPISEVETESYAKAAARGRATLEHGPTVSAVRVDASKREIDIELPNGVRFIVPVRLIQGLDGAGPDELSDIEIWAGGLVINWEQLDVQMHVPSLVAGVFGTQRWMSELGRAGGSAKSAAKARAARANGKKGGRPKRIAPRG
jgi:hypothetical protein